MDYQQFIAQKSQANLAAGFKPTFMPEFLYDFQKFLVDWSVNQGRGAIFSDCGSGKSPMQLVWAENIIRKTNKPVLILTPLAVSAQTERESEKFDIEAKVSRDGKVHPNITIANYERLHYFNYQDFGGVVCDESSILKNFKGMIKDGVTEFMRRVPYLLQIILNIHCVSPLRSKPISGLCA